MNCNLLKYYMRENDDTIESLAEDLKLHYNTVSLKLNGKREFTQLEIALISKRYNLNAEEVVKIFFLIRRNKHEEDRCKQKFNF